jgi:hypothetical protein
MRAENSLNHDKKRCVTSWLVQLEKEGRKTETRDEEEAEKHE